MSSLVINGDIPNYARQHYLMIYYFQSCWQFPVYFSLTGPFIKDMYMYLLNRVDECKYMDSAMRPLWLVWRNSDAFGDKVKIMFKAGDGTCDTLFLPLSTFI